MGAEFSMERVGRTNFHKAWRETTEYDTYWFGHSGYTGTMAEKDGAIDLGIVVDSFEEAERLAVEIDDNCVDHLRPEQRINPDYPKYASDKWGYAGAIKVGDLGWLFFGWCSS